MGISTMQSYCGAQIFEALGLAQSFVDKYFTWTPTRIEGIGLHEVYEEVARRHRHAYPERPYNGHVLPTGGEYQWRHDGERHLFNPQTIHYLQQAVRNNDYAALQALFRAGQRPKPASIDPARAARLSSLAQEPIPLDEVEPVESIVKRFKTGAMSYGSISKEAHETLAIAMNRIGGRSNTGEGGEDPTRYVPDENGDSRNSAIKQVASGRFGVTSLLSGQRPGAADQDGAGRQAR